MTTTSDRFTRNRRLRQSASLRDLMRETRVHAHDLVAPVFVTDDPLLEGAIASLPGVRRHGVDRVAEVVSQIASAGVRGILLFGVPKHKDDQGSGAWSVDGVVARAIRSVRAAGLDIAIFADVCLCQYTTHGHCDIHPHSVASNDDALVLVTRAAVAYAEAGATMVAPSGMLDGVVASIRGALDAEGHSHVGILSYAVKHASALYGPFRDAAQSAPTHGDRRTQQLDPANVREALREASADVDEGADIVMVKPAITNLDTLVRLRIEHPSAVLAAYEVSGEYAMIRAAAQAGWLGEREVIMEYLTAIKRAGADLIITYSAVEVAHWLRSQGAN